MIKKRTTQTMFREITPVLGRWSSTGVCYSFTISVYTISTAL